MSPPPQIVTMLRIGKIGEADVASTSRLIAPIEFPTKCADSIPNSAQKRATCLILMPRPSLKSITFAD